MANLFNTMLLKSAGPQYPANAFVLSVNTANAGSANTTFIVPTSSSGTYNCVVDWGDNSTSTITTFNDPNWTHVYASPGIYIIKIIGTFNGIVFNNAGDKAKAKNIYQWGTDFRLGVSQRNYFSGCSNLTITATDTLNLTGTTTLASVFNGCSSITTIPSINNWNYSNVNSLAQMLQNCTSFNQPINFTTSSTLTTTASMLNGCSAFNNTVSISDMTGVTTVVSMLQNCTSFNQAINFTTSNALTLLTSMLNGCSAFNSTVSISNTSHVTAINSMFLNCLVFDKDVSTFSIAALTNATNMLSGSGFTATNYNKLLDSTTGWPSQATIQNNVTFNAGTAHYNTANAIAGRALLTGVHNWTITDGGTP